MKAIVLFFIFIISVSLISVGSLLASQFNPWVSIVLSLGICLLAWKALAKSPFLQQSVKPSVYAFAVLLLAILFRYPTYEYIIGGQDQGVYANVAQYYYEKGSYFKIDQLRENMKALGLADFYNRYNTYDRKEYPGGYQTPPGKYDENSQPGVYMADTNTSKLVFQSYPLMPVWLSVGKTLFGEANASLIIVLLGIVSIFSVSAIVNVLMAKEIFAIPGLVCGALLAAHPLHSFFSKYPVTEIPTLAFLSTSILLLLFYIKSKEKYFLLLSALSFFCVFLFRISGFVYAPFFFALMIASLTYLKDKWLFIYTVVIAGLFALSLWVGLTVTFPYVFDIMIFDFVWRFGNKWYLYIAGGCAAGILAVILIRWIFISKIEQLDSKKVAVVVNSLLVGLIVLLIALIFTIKTQMPADLDPDFFKFHEKKTFFYLSSAWMVLVFFGFIGLGLFAFALNWLRKSTSLMISMLLTFLFVAWFFGAMMQPIWTYLYYFGRYGLIELVPTTLVVLTIYVFSIQNEKWKKACFAVFAGLFAYYSYFSYFHIGKAETGKSFARLKEFSKLVSDNDLIIYPEIRRDYWIPIKLPLTTYFGKSVMNVPAEYLDNSKEFKKIVTSGFFNNIYIFTSEPYYSNYATYAGRIDLDMSTMKFSWMFPKKYQEAHRNFNLYIIDKSAFSAQNKVISLQSIPGSKEGVHVDGWLESKVKIVNTYLDTSSAKKFKLVSQTVNPMENNNQEVSISIHFNGLLLEKESFKDGVYIFKIPKMKDSIVRTIDIEFDKYFVPKEHGIGEDNRKLSMLVSDIEIVE